MTLLIFSLLNSAISQNLIQNKFLNLWITSKYSLSKTAYLLEKHGFRTRTISEWEKKISGYFPYYLEKYKKVNKLIKNVKIVQKGRKFEKINILSLSPSDYGKSFDVLNFLNLIEAHKKGFIGENVLISIFDSGFELSHPALNHLKEGKRIKFTYDFESGDSLILIYRNDTINLPHPNSVGYIQNFDFKNIKDTIYIFFSYLDEKDNKKNLWRIYATYFAQYTFGNLIVLNNDTPSLSPKIEIFNNKIILVNKIILPGSEGLKIYYLDKNLQKDSSKIISLNNIINDFEIFKTNNTFYITFCDSNNFYIYDKNLNEIKRLNKKIEEFEVEVKNDTTIISYTGDINNSKLGIILFDSLFNLLKDTVIDYGFAPRSLLIGDTLRVLYLKGEKIDSLYEANYIISLNSINKKFIDKGFFIRSYDYLKNLNDVKIYYAKNGLLYQFKNEIIDSTPEYFTDLLNTYQSYLIFRRRGDKYVNLNPLTDYTNFSYPGILHGTRMLALIAGYAKGQMVGAAPGANFLLFKTERVVTKDGQTEFEHLLEEDFWVEALELSRRLGAKIVSSSLGYSDWYTKNDMDGKTAISSRAASKALSKGLLVVTAAGNLENPHPDITKPDTTIVAPGDADSVITVGGCYLNGEVWERSAFGPTADGRIKPDVVAPFRALSIWMDTTSTGDTLYFYAEGEGTSISTALTAGLCAVALSAHPEWDVKKLYEVILKTSSKSLNPDNIYGYGVPDALKIINYESIKIPYKEGEKSRIISIYPNPSKSGKIKIDYVILESITPLYFKFFTPSGKKIMELSYNLKPFGRYKEEIILKSKNGKKFPPGLYIVVMETSENKDFYKLVIEK